MKSLKYLLSGIGFLLVAILTFLFTNAGWGFMLVPCLIAFVIGCILLVGGILSTDI